MKFLKLASQPSGKRSMILVSLIIFNLSYRIIKLVVLFYQAIIITPFGWGRIAATSCCSPAILSLLQHAFAYLHFSPPFNHLEAPPSLPSLILSACPPGPTRGAIHPVSSLPHALHSSLSFLLSSVKNILLLLLLLLLAAVHPPPHILSLSSPRRACMRERNQTWHPLV